MKFLKDLFNLDIFKKCKIIAGEKGLDRSVNFVNISDTDDIASMLNENDLLLTTGYGFKDDAEKLNKFIISLNNIGVSGLIIKENRFIKEIPPSVVETANQLNFPILILTGNSTLGELSSHITGYLCNYKSAELFHAINLQKEFTDMMLKNHNIDYLLHKLSLIIDTSVVLLDYKLDIISASTYLDKNNDILIENIISIIKSDKDKYGSCTNESLVDVNTSKQTTFSTFIVPTVYHIPNILIVLDSNKLIYPLSNTSIEQIIYALSFCIIKNQMQFKNKSKIKSTFFFDMLYGNISNTSEFIKKGSQYGLKDSCKYMCITGSFDFYNPYKNSEIANQNKVSLATFHLINSVEKKSKELNLDTIVFTQNTYFIIIIQIEQYNNVIQKLIEDLIFSVQKGCFDDMPISFGVSSPVRNITKIKNAYLDSLQALNLGYDLQKSNFVQYYKIQESRDILQMLPEKTLKEFSSNILGRLVLKTSKEKNILLQTLKAYIDNKYDLSKTARALYVHRNTVKYRLSRCEELLDMSLNDSSDSFTIQLALEIQSMLS